MGIYWLFEVSRKGFLKGKGERLQGKVLIVYGIFEEGVFNGKSFEGLVKDLYEKGGGKDYKGRALEG